MQMQHQWLSAITTPCSPAFLVLNRLFDKLDVCFARRVLREWRLVYSRCNFLGEQGHMVVTFGKLQGIMPGSGGSRTVSGARICHAVAHAIHLCDPLHVSESLNPYPYTFLNPYAVRTRASCMLTLGSRDGGFSSTRDISEV
jgi:hypothetical protein